MNKPNIRIPWIVRGLTTSAILSITIISSPVAEAKNSRVSESIQRIASPNDFEVTTQQRATRGNSANLKELLQQARKVPPLQIDETTARQFANEAFHAMEMNEDKVPDQYLVFMKKEHFPIHFKTSARKGRRLLSADGILAEEFAVHMMDEVGGKLNRLFQNTRPVFSAKLSSDQVEELRKHPLVESIVPNLISRSATQWGQDRVDQTSLPLNNSYKTDKTGAGVHVYVFDTGLRSTHNEFVGRVGPGTSTSYASTNDGEGHGTHVAGIIAGETYGVAPQATVHPVKVLSDNGTGTLADFINGVNWTIANHDSTQPGVANMSLSFRNCSTQNGSVAADDIVQDLINSGITTVVSAGNKFPLDCSHVPFEFLWLPVDASTVSPARLPAAITVGATAVDDTFASFSSFGAGVDILAPGDSITSAGITSDSSNRTISGTSQAAPHVAGVAALLLQDEPDLTPAQVEQRLVSTSSSNKITGLVDYPNLSWDNTRDDTPNRLLFYPRTNGASVAAPTNAWLELDFSTLMVNLNWTDNADNEIKFQIERSTDLVNWQVVAEPFANQESYSDPIQGGLFFYRIRGVGHGAATPTFSAYASFASAPEPGSESLSGELDGYGGYFWETLVVEVPSGATASGSTSADTIAQNSNNMAFAIAHITGPNLYQYTLSGGGSGLTGFQTDSFSSGTSGTYTLEIEYITDGNGSGHPYAWAEATISWE